MKTLIVSVILLIGISSQAFSMGHPHNLFAARKLMRVKTAASVNKHKTTSCVDWKQAVQAGKADFTNRLFIAFSHIRPVRFY
jgi:hypothetical protein